MAGIWRIVDCGSALRRTLRFLWATFHRNRRGFCKCIERANLEDVVGSLAYALVEVVGRFLTMVAHWRSLEGWNG